MITVADFRLPRKISLQIDQSLFDRIKFYLDNDIRLSDSFHYACNDTGKFELYDYYNEKLTWNESNDFLRCLFSQMVEQGTYAEDDIYAFL